MSKKHTEKSVTLAEQIQQSIPETKKSEFTKRIEGIIHNPSSKVFLIRMMDVAFRSKNYNKVSNYINKLFKKYKNISGLFVGIEQALVFLYQKIGYLIPPISIPAMLTKIKSVTSPVVFFVGSDKFKKHSYARKNENITLNVNLIGEALLGEEEAAERIHAYKELLNRDEVDYISIKLSTIFSQINSLAHEFTVDRCVEKISQIYDEVLQVKAKTGRTKFVNLDMEEYRDLPITIDAFKKALEIDRFKDLRMGIVLQAYLPDAYPAMIDLAKWAQNRVKNGGAPIKIRIVKGANLEMEMTESSMENWPIAPYESKMETDANYKKMLNYLLQKDVLKSVNVGVASHNLFDLSFALNIVKENNLFEYVDFEMLEGMANETVAVLQNEGGRVILYTPIVHSENYVSAIAYLVRRLDESTQDGNFLKEGFDLKLHSSKWNEIQNKYLESIKLIDTVSNEPKRNQDRNNQSFQVQSQFSNVPNTDWTLAQNREWIKGAINAWKTPTDVVGDIIPVIGELDIKKRESITQVGWDGPLPFQYELATEADYEEAINSASEWTALNHDQRINLLKKAAIEIEKDRSNLICVAVLELGKTIKEVDVEVSEAIDFANYYAQSISDIQEAGIDFSPRGINLILSPWNFPVAIPIGGVLATLAAGKKAILKPSTNAAATAYLTCQCLWKAGIPKSALFFLPARESTLDKFLSQGNHFDAVILTGGTDTAKFLLNRNPELNLFAETGGKNSTIVTSLADRDQAIDHVVQSAFGNSGQKCSATSLLILEEEVFNDKKFKKLLKDATQSRIFGNPWHLETIIGPLAVPPSDKIKHSIKNTPEQQWLVKPELKENFYVTPGIKWNINTTDYEYNHELFGPILSVMKAKDLNHAIDLVNGVDYGLTSGIESLDEDEVNHWKENIMAGNIYANRTTTGAIVERQPFGGMKASCFGFGMKAGGPNYVLQFVNIETPKTALKDIIDDYKITYQQVISKMADPSQIRGQHNIFRYLKAKMICLLIDKESNKKDIKMIEAVADVMKIPLEIYCIDDVQFNDFNFTKLSSWDNLIEKIHHGVVFRALAFNSLSDNFIKACIDKSVHIYKKRPSPHGRIELLNYIEEQSISINYHRYGNQLGIKNIK